MRLKDMQQQEAVHDIIWHSDAGTAPMSGLQCRISDCPPLDTSRYRLRNEEDDRGQNSSQANAMCEGSDVREANAMYS